MHQHIHCIGKRTQLVRPQDSSLGSLRLLLLMVLATQNLEPF